MKTWNAGAWMAIAAMALPLAAQTLDLRAIEKYADKAEDSVDVTLHTDLIKLGLSFLGSTRDKDAQALKDAIGGLRSIRVRSFKFAAAGVYQPADVEAVTSQLKGWSPIVSVKEKTDRTGIWFKEGEGLTIVTSAPREVTVVSIEGRLDLNKLAQLGEALDIDEIQEAGKVLKKQGAATPRPAPAPAPKKEEEEM